MRRGRTDAHSLLLFGGAGLLLDVTPVPTSSTSSAGACRGRAAAVLSAVGIEADCIVHVAGAALGLSALLLVLPLAPRSGRGSRQGVA